MYIQMKKRKTRRLKRRVSRKTKKKKIRKTRRVRRKKQLKGGAEGVIDSVKDIDKVLNPKVEESNHIYELLRDNSFPEQYINITPNEEDIKDIILQLLINGFNFEIQFHVEDYTFTRILSDIHEIWYETAGAPTAEEIAAAMNEFVFDEQVQTNISTYNKLLNELYEIILSEQD